MATKKEPTAAPAAAHGDANEEKRKMLTVSDERMRVVMRHVDRGLSKAHVTTLEQLIASRLIAVSALAQMANDNPQADRLKLIDDVCDDLRQALKKRILPEIAVGHKGEA